MGSTASTPQGGVSPPHANTPRNDDADAVRILPVSDSRSARPSSSSAASPPPTVESEYHRAAFALFDHDGNGTIEKHELDAALHHLGFEPCEIATIWAEVGWWCWRRYQRSGCLYL